jgi:23S rRNA (uracil1939-C5)-methyltransferase
LRGKACKHAPRLAKIAQCIAQIKDKHGIKERENYNIGEGKSKELICPPEKEEAITNALKHFNMI